MKKSKERLAKDASAKAQGSIMEITIEDSGKEKVLYLKMPHRYVIGKYWKLADENLIQAKEFLLRSCVLEKISDMDVLENDDLFYAASSEVIGIFDVIKVKKSTYTIL